MSQIVISCLVTGVYCQAGNFVIKKGERQRPSEVKEEIAESYERLLKKCSQTIGQLSASSEQLVCSSRALLEDKCTKNCTQLNCYKEQLQKYEQRIDALQTDISSLHRHLCKGLPQ